MIEDQLSHYGLTPEDVEREDISIDVDMSMLIGSLSTFMGLTPEDIIKFSILNFVVDLETGAITRSKVRSIMGVTDDDNTGC